MDISEAVKIKKSNIPKRHPWETTRLKIIVHFLKTQQAYPFNHIADIGCGDGYVLKKLLQEDAAMHFSAVDPFFNDDIINHLKTVPNAERVRFYRNASDITGNEPVFDCVLLLDVLEHVPDDKNLLLEVKRQASLKKSTWIITVPAFQSLFSNHDKLLQHYRRYNLKQLTALCEKCGLTIEKKGYFFLSLIPLRIIQKKNPLFSKKGTTTTIEDWRGGKTLGVVLETALWFDFRISLLLSKLKIYIPGLSCYCICH